ncbi:MAG: hypothetical protein IKH76_07045 [Clostridiales bacterium]|nr:hypothetical protein [Clostridiales bacterium]
MPDKQVKSKQRVADHGEVFTAQREVNAMLDLVKDETERIDSRFLEPACGEGAFLKEILNRKLAVVKRQYGKSPYDYERYSVLAVTSIYGVDILEDNAEICRQNLYEIWNKEYTKNTKSQANDQCRETVRFILSKNILCGDALTMLKNDGTPIVFAEWNLVTGDQIKRRDYEFAELLDGHEKQMNIFMLGWEYDEEINAFIPSPVKEYPLTDYRRLADYE